MDESIFSAGNLAKALKHQELKCYALKIGKFGGIQPALQFVRMANARGMSVWMGGMYDTGISRRMHAAFQMLPGVVDAGDIGATSRYFDVDVTDPPYTVERGMVTLERRGHEHGLGCTLDRSAAPSVRAALRPRPAFVRVPSRESSHAKTRIRPKHYSFASENILYESYI